MTYAAHVSFNVMNKRKRAVASIYDSEEELSAMTQRGPVFNDIINYRGVFATKREADMAIYAAVGGWCKIAWTEAALA